MSHLQTAVLSRPTLRTHVVALKSASARTGLSPSMVHHSRVSSHLVPYGQCVITLQLVTELAAKIKKCWAFPGSLAVTKGIVFTFFSSPY